MEPQRRLAGRAELDVVGGEHGQLVVGHGLDAAVAEQYTTGIGQPQNRWRDSSQSRSRKLTLR